MKIHCSKEDMTQGVQMVQSALAARTTLPILSSFLLETENLKLKVVSTDLEMGVKHYMGVEIEKEGSVAIPAKKFSDILHSLPDGQDIELSVGVDGKIQLKCGRSRFGITGSPKSDYPQLPEFSKQNAFEVPAFIIGDMVRKTIFAASSDETRHVLNGVFWSARKDDLEMVATDGRRLSISCKKNIFKDKDFQIIVPIKILTELLRLLNTYDIKEQSLEKILISVTDNQIAFQFKETTLLSRLVGGNFPNYQQVIPNKKDVIVEVHTKELLATTKRASLCVADRGGAIKYTFKTSVLQVTASSPNFDFNDELPIEFNGDEFQIAFNPQFMVDALKHVDSERVVLGLTAPTNPMLIEPQGHTDYRFVVMPMRL